jgi:hypothetical protein
VNAEKPRELPSDGVPRRPHHPAPDAPLIPTRSSDDSDTGWGERPDDANDDRLLRDVPPHW